CDKINNTPKGATRYNKYVFGIFVKGNLEVQDDYFGEIPTEFGELVDWASKRGLDIKEALKLYEEKGLHLVKGVPITIAIKRPRMLIGTDSDTEYLNFVVTSKEHGIQDDSSVFMLSHRKPVNRNFAREISKYNGDNANKSIVFGCGAVGSKVVLHLAKAGMDNIILVDDDKMSPHNLIRHGLLSQSVGKNKAAALVEEIQRIYYADKDNTRYSSEKKLGESFLQGIIISEKYNIIIDATASNVFQNYLADFEGLRASAIVRCEITFNGNLGILKVEGNKRTPRIDDLNIHLYDLAIDDDYLSTWLNEYYVNINSGGFEYEEISIGASCNSDTVKLADDIISIHSATFSMAIKRVDSQNNGYILLSKLDQSDQIMGLTEKVPFPGTVEKAFKNDQKWRLRIGENNIDLLKNKLKENLPNETGGLLVGRVDVKRKIIYVTRILDAPEDSKKTPYSFVRGVKDVPEILEKIRNRTGHLIDFVGEWHTHTNKVGKLSQTDKGAITALRKSLDKIPFPTFILVVTENTIHPYIFGPSEIIHK
ncbi:MAG: ThiF family adenylyltransferase, partial [Leptospiraceae bacterium]|nr:ThiF family adenylyltransferase [Leptospiraceae bacterium]